MVLVKRNNRLKMGIEARIRHVKLLQLKKKYRYMTGGSRSRFIIRFALNQLKSNKKSGLHSKLPTKPGRRWTITFLGQKTESPPEDDVKDDEGSVSVESESEGKVEEGEGYWDSYESSLSDDNEDNPQEPTFSFELRSQMIDNRNSGPAAKPSVEFHLGTQTYTIGSLRSLGLGPILERIKEHISTSHCQHVPLKDIVFRGSLDGCSPLIMACHYGDLKTVKYLVENWGVGVNETAVYYKYLEPEPQIEEASPVFVASYNRHFKIVEYLIRKGADLSLKTSSLQHLFYHNMTPLLGALRQHLTGAFCYDTCSDHTEPEDVETIVIPLVRLLLENGANPPTLQDGYPIWTELASNSVNLTTLLIHHGMELNQQNSGKETVFHHWANLENTNEEDSLIVVKLLVDKGANLMIRAENGDTPILIAVESRNWTVLDFLVDTDHLDRTEKIDALEMAAALIFMESDEYDSHVERAFGYLRRALLLREEKRDPIRKIPLTLESGRTIEWTTTAEVEAGIKNTTEYKIQSYLAFLRIFHDRSSIAGRSMLVRSLSVCCSDLSKQHRFDDIRDVLWATLDSFPNTWEILHVIDHLVSMMSQLENTHHLFTAKTFKKPLKSLLATELYWASYNEKILLKLVACLARNAKFLIDEDIKESLRNLVAQESRISREHMEPTMLHEACQHPDDLFAIRLLLLSGANPNASHINGNGPLHILATQYRRWLFIDAEVVGSAARLLLKYGAHLCKVNRKRETAAQLWKRENGNLNDRLPDWLREEKVKKLQCQCARVITSQKVSYEEDELPANLHLFVEAHRHPS